MSCSKVCKEQRALLFAAINSLVQSTASILFGIFAILMHACIVTPSPPSTVERILASYSAFSSGFYEEYFHSRNNCMNRNVDQWKTVQNFTLGVVTSSDHVQTLFAVYLADNAIWLLATILFLIGIQKKLRWTYIIYAASQFIIMLYDVILCIIFGLDIQSYMNLVTDRYRITKSQMLTNIIVMMLISMRFLLFYITNIVFFIYVVRAIKLLEEETKPNLPTSHTIKNPQVQKNQHLQRMNPQHPQQTAILDYPDIIKHQSDEGVPRNEMDPFNERGPLREVGRFDDRGPHREIRHFDERGQHQEVDPFDDRGHHSVQKMTKSPALPRRRYSPPRDYELTNNAPDYDKAEPHYNSEYRLSMPKSNSNSDDESSNIPVKISALRRSSSNVELLKNQKPWSYIRPEDLPFSSNKLKKLSQQHSKSGPSLEPVQQEADETEQGTSLPPEDAPLSRAQKKQHQATDILF